MPVTIQHLAKTAGVSRSTANMILTGKSDRYAIDTCDRVKKAAIKLGYTPNIAARSLRHNRSFLIGAIFNRINGNYASEYLSGLEDRALPKGCAPAMLVAESPEAELEALQILSERRVDGLIVNPLPTGEDKSPVVQEILRLRKRGLPIVELLGTLCGPTVPSVNIDGYQAGYQVTQKAIDLGCARPMLVMQENVPERTAMNWFLQDFYRGCDDAVKASGNEPLHALYQSSPTWDPLATARSIIGDQKPGGVITLSRAMSSQFAFIANCQPELVAEKFVLCGVDHLIGEVDCRFHKVVVRNAMREAVEQAADMLFAMIDGSKGDAADPAMNVTLPPTVQHIKPLSM